MTNPSKSVTNYPLSSTQREIWFDQILYPDIPLYNIGGYLRIDGPIDPALFEKALNQIIQDNDALRIILQQGKELPTQIFAEHIHITLDFHDFSAKDNPHHHAIQWMQQEFVKPLQLYNTPLFQLALCKASDNCYYYFNKCHHLIVDGFGISLIGQYLATAYNTLVKGQQNGKKTFSYIEFLKNDQQYLNSEKFQQQQRYWQNKYQQLPEPLIQHRYITQFQGQVPSQRSILYLKRAFYNQLMVFAKEHRVSTFHVILGVLYCYFVRTCDREDFVIGLPVLNRNTAIFKKTVGLFTSVSPAWFRFETDLSFIKLIQAISTTLQKDYRHQRFPISTLNKQLGLHKEGRHQLFDITLSYAKHDYDIHFNGNPARAVYFTHGFEQNALAIFIEEFHQDEGVNVYFDYSLGAFDEDEINRFKARFEFLLGEVLRQPSVPICSLQIMPKAELNKILVEFNNTAVNYPRNKTLVDLFVEQVDNRPEAIAIVFEDQQLTYQELNSKANQLAHYLQHLGVQPEILVGICLERSLEMIIGLLGILKAGGTYVPLDPTYPTARLAYMLEDADIKILLTQSNLIKKLPSHQAPVVCLDTDDEMFSGLSSDNPVSGVKPSHLAYVIYTSGSTGKPKGVQIVHHSVTNFLHAMQHSPGLTVQDILLAVTTISFDIAVLELYLPLMVGAQIVLVSSEIASDGAQLLEKLNHCGATVMQATPATWRMLLMAGWESSPFLKILIGGEALPRELAHQLQEKGTRVWNLYGPTETTVWSTCYPITTTPLLENSTEGTELIGRPIANTQLYILDRNEQPTPIGVAGELYIGGTGLARGYLNHPELTQNKFISNPFSDDQTARLYKTGDLARYWPDGNIEYLGRIDNQVKIRGFRIELGEIETILAQHPAVQETAVIVHKDALENKRLITYVVPHPQQVIETIELRRFLQEKLPFSIFGLKA